MEMGEAQHEFLKTDIHVKELNDGKSLNQLGLFIQLAQQI